MAEEALTKAATNESQHLDSIIEMVSPEEFDGEGEEKKKPETEKKDETITVVKEEAKPAEKQEVKEEYVKHSALHEERERRKEMAAELAKEKEERLILKRELEALKNNAQKPEEEYADPLQKLEAKTEKIEQALTTEAEQRKAAEENYKKEVVFFTKYKASADAFAKDTPDFMDAYNYLDAARKKEIALFTKGDDKIKQQLLSEERYIVEQAYANEENPARVLFEMAKSRGYKPSAKGEAKQEDKIDTLEKGLKASKSLGTGGSGDSDASIKNLSPAALASMSDKEFDKIFSQHTPAQYRH